MAKPTPFKIAVPEDQLQWITDRVKTTRLPPGKELPSGKEWQLGPPNDVARRMQKYWIEEYDWRKVEAEINAELDMFTLPISHAGEDLTMHFVHHRSSSPNAIPLLFIHGWPGNFLEVRHIIKDLVTPSDPSAQAYHVIAPSLPGFGFSSYPKGKFQPEKIATVLNKLMIALGYNKYVVQGGDWGSVLGRLIATQHSENVAGLHINMIFALLPSILSAPVAMLRVILGFTLGWNKEEGARLKRMMWWQDEEGAYQHIQGTKPLALQYALTDSPFGMMCWLYDKMKLLVDDSYKWKDEEVITWAMTYILNGSAGHGEVYTWNYGDDKAVAAKSFSSMIPASVPLGVSYFPADVMYAQKWWAEASVSKKIVFWKEHKVGGHFASLEQPEALIADIREFTAAGKLAEKFHKA